MNRLHTKAKICLRTKSLIWKNFNLNKLTKKKWILFKKNLKKKTYNTKSLSLKHLFNLRLLNKQKLKSFYGNILNYQLLTIYDNVPKNLNRKQIHEFLILLEQRLDVVLFRIGYSKTIFESQQIINHKKIFVNNRIVNSSNYYLKNGDIISFHDKDRNLSDLKLLKYVEFNKILNYYIFIRSPVFNEIIYPFTLDINLLSASLRKKI